MGQALTPPCGSGPALDVAPHPRTTRADLPTEALEIVLGELTGPLGST